MEPLSLIFSAIISGAASALQPTAAQAVKDGYDGLKALIKKKWDRIEIDSLERDPRDEARQQLVKSDLQKVEHLADPEIMERASGLLSAIRKHDPAAAQRAGISIEDLEAGASINIQHLAAMGTVHVRQVKAGQDINIGGVSAGNPYRR